MHLGDIVLHVWCGAVWQFDAGEQRYTPTLKKIKLQSVTKIKLQSVTTVFAFGRHNGKGPLFHAATQSNVKHCNVKCHQSVSNVISMHRVHCGYIVHAFGIPW